jgi:cullin-associated NEDD8-dissociated protein 1
MTGQLNKLLEKTSDWDKDERYMATNDLCSLLQNYSNNSKDEAASVLKMDENMEQRICTAILKQLDDQSNDVQSVAVKCLAILLKKVQQEQIGEICKKLCSLILIGKDTLRDIYSIGLKTLIADVPSSMGNLVVQRLSGKLLSGIDQSDEEIKRECLDIMTELLSRFGHLMDDKEHQSIMEIVVKQLLEVQSQRTVVRKRASNCLGALAVVASDNLLNHTVQLLLDQIEISEKASAGSSTHQDLTRTLIQTIGTISRTSVGYRLGRHLERIVPLFLRFCGDPADESQQTDASNELRENCFPGLESFVLRCPREVSPFITNILHTSMGFMKYDPNYQYDEEDDTEAMDEEGGSDAGEGSDFEEEEEGGWGSDEDDSSWKVRKAAVKVVCAVIVAKPELLNELYDTCIDGLISRFKEREENVRLDIINCLMCLIQASNSSEAGKSSSAVSGIAMLEDKSNSIINAACTLLGGQSTKTKSAVFALLRSMIVILGPKLNSYSSRLLNAVEKSLTDKNQALKLDALVFLRLSLDHLSPSVTQPALGKVLPLVIAIVAEEWYKLIAEALRALSSIITTIRPKDPSSPGCFDDSFDYASFTAVIFGSISSRLEALDIDQEIKECAITAVGLLFSHCGTCLAPRLPHVLSVLHRRLENEVTRIPTLKALNTMASSDSVTLDLSSFLLSAGKDLAQYLRQSSRSLKQLTLQTLTTLIQSTSHFNKTGQKASVQWQDHSMVMAIFAETSSLVGDADLHLTHLCIQLFITILSDPNAVKLATEPFEVHVYPKLCTLAKSCLLQGLTLQSLIKLLQSLSASNLAHMGFQNLFHSLYLDAAISSELDSAEFSNKQSLSNLSKCVAGICLVYGTDGAVSIRETAIVQFTSDLSQLSASSGSPLDEARKQLALLCLGEIGQYTNLAGTPGLKELIPSFFGNGHSEDTKLAAAYSLGHIAVGNLDVFLPVVLPSDSSTESVHQYLLLATLKEIIVVMANRKVDFQSYLSMILPVLLAQCQATEESVRSMVAECLGVLTAIPVFTSQIIPILLNLLQQDEDKLTRRMIANAMRFTLSRSSDTSEINPVMDHFLLLLDDDDLEVKKAALVMVNTATHHNPNTVEAHLENFITPRLVETLKIKLERSVDLGPFKHKVDDNLPLRKASLTCIETIVDTMPHALDAASFMVVMPLLLTDKDEIKLKAHQILTKIGRINPGAIISNIDLLIEPLEKTIMKKSSKELAGGPEVERANELIRSAARASLSVNQQLNNDVTIISRKWADFIERIRRHDTISAIVSAIENDSVLVT